MDVLSHALWGYAVTRWRGPRSARWGALLGAAPDLVYSGASMAGALSTTGSLSQGPRNSDPGIWRSDGPPQPPELTYIYETYYVWTHSLVIVGLIALIYYLVWRRPPWLMTAAALHVLMDIPTHERWQTPFLYPLSDITILGYGWSRPPMLIANYTALGVVYMLLYWRYWRSRTLIVDR